MKPIKKEPEHRYWEVIYETIDGGLKVRHRAPLSMITSAPSEEEAITIILKRDRIAHLESVRTTAIAREVSKEEVQRWVDARLGRGGQMSTGEAEAFDEQAKMLPQKQLTLRSFFRVMREVSEATLQHFKLSSISEFDAAASRYWSRNVESAFMESEIRHRPTCFSPVDFVLPDGSFTMDWERNEHDAGRNVADDEYQSLEEIEFVGLSNTVGSVRYFDPETPDGVLFPNELKLVSRLLH